VRDRCPSLKRIVTFDSPDSPDFLFFGDLTQNASTARPFAEGTLFKLGYAYEQGTRHRKPPDSTPPLPGEP